MDVRKLMSGIAVVIDDALTDSNGDESDKVFDVIRMVEHDWNIPFYKANKIPPDEVCRNLLQAASFILLDWRLWPNNAPELERAGIEENINFLEMAKEYFIPIFIFTNEDFSDVVEHLDEPLYYEQQPEKNFIFIEKKDLLIKEGHFNSDRIVDWIEGNASVYVLKTWEQAFYLAKKQLFGSMYAKNPNWPKVFWKAYESDGVDQSTSIIRLINDNLLGRIETPALNSQILDPSDINVSKEDVELLMHEASFVDEENAPENEIRVGALFKISEGKYLINIRPSCDCVPRDGGVSGGITLYCIEGQEMSDSDLSDSYKANYGCLTENVAENIVFSLHEGKTVRFRFRNLHLKKFSAIKDKYVGYLIHPHITKMQQRYASYLQRLGLPRIPEEASPATNPPLSDRNTEQV